MAEQPVTDRQLALLLQVSRDFAFEQMARDGRLVPFVTRAKASGEIEFARFVDQHTERPLADVYAEAQETLAGEASRGEIVASGLVAAVTLDPPLEGFGHALRVHVEAPGYSRQVLVPYGIEPAAEGGDGPSLKLGRLVPQQAAPAVFPG